MCGLAGFVNYAGHSKGDALARVKRMTDAVVHRGPDDDGFFVDNYVALGHRRLSIIDLESGHQPMSDLGEMIQIVFNGEIYNFQELRKTLEQCGHRFLTHSDTEVIIKCYLEWGEECASRLNGMFAFAIWDVRNEKLFLARDRVGKKPLYYRYENDVFTFSSELKSIATAARCDYSVDEEALECFLTMGYIPAPKTIYREVRKMLPAHILVVTKNGMRTRRYWELSFGSQTDTSLDKATDELEALLDDAVRCRLISDVPLGAFLSGGLDSSLVVASMSRLLKSPVKTHTIGFEDSKFNEVDAARKVSNYLHTSHHEFTVQPSAADILPKIAWHFDEPFGDSSALPTWYVCESTRKSVTVALSGDGGDEAFGGYTFRYLPHMQESRIRNVIPPVLRHAIFGPLGRLWPSSAKLPRVLRLKSILENLATTDAQAYYRDLIWLRNDVRQKVYRPEFMSSLNGFTSFEMVHSFYTKSDAIDALGRSQFTDVNVYMTDDVLTKVDRMSMAHSLEVRSPLLDYRILEFAASLPSRIKVNMTQGKLPLRSLAERRLRPGAHNLPKQGFSIPAATWLRNELRPMVEEYVFATHGLVASTLDAEILRQLWSQHLHCQRDHSVFFWALLMLGLWDKTCRPAP